MSSEISWRICCAYVNLLWAYLLLGRIINTCSLFWCLLALLFSFSHGFNIFLRRLSFHFALIFRLFDLLMFLCVLPLLLGFQLLAILSILLSGCWLTGWLIFNLLTLDLLSLSRLDGLHLLKLIFDSLVVRGMESTIVNTA